MFQNLTFAQIATDLTVIGVVCGFLFKIFSAFSQIKSNKEDIKELEGKIKLMEEANEKQKEELLDKVEETNSAVNLLCLGLSALIDNELNENSNKDELREIKKKLDEKKEIV